MYIIRTKFLLTYIVIIHKFEHSKKKHLKYTNEAHKINTLIIMWGKFLAMSPTCQPSHYNLKESPITLATTKFLQYLFQYLMKKKTTV